MSEELNLNKRTVKKGLGRGLGSLLGEMTNASASAGASHSEEAFSNNKIKVPSKEPVKVNTQPEQQQAQAKVIQAESAATNTDKIWRVDIEKLTPNKEQPRKHFDSIKIGELAASIKEKGILLPIVVKKIANNQFEIIAGERRWRGAQKAGLQEVPVVIRDHDPREALEIAIIENIQRQDLNPMEEAEAYSLLAGRYGLTQQQIAEKVSKERSTIANLMRLTLLASEVKKLVREEHLQLGQAKVLLAIENPQEQLRLAQKVIQNKLSVRATERLVQKTKEDPKLQLEDVSIHNKREIQPLISELQRLLGTKVDVQMSGQKSTVSVHFYSMPELNAFIDKLRKTKT